MATFDPGFDAGEAIEGSQSVGEPAAESRDQRQCEGAVERVADESVAPRQQAERAVVGRELVEPRRDPRDDGDDRQQTEEHDLRREERR